MDDKTVLPSQTELNDIWRGLNENLPDFRFEWSARMRSTGATIYLKERRIILSIRLYLEYGMDETINSLKHEAAHYLAWSKHGDRGHGQWFWYYLGFFRAPRHSPQLSASIKEQSLRVTGQRSNKGIEYDPVTKTFKQRR